MPMLTAIGELVKWAEKLEWTVPDGRGSIGTPAQARLRLKPGPTGLVYGLVAACGRAKAM
jgi:hypothetical protein